MGLVKGLIRGDKADTPVPEVSDLVVALDAVADPIALTHIDGRQLVLAAFIATQDVYAG
jgi:hypothetical protein